MKKPIRKLGFIVDVDQNVFGNDFTSEEYKKLFGYVYNEFSNELKTFSAEEVPQYELYIGTVKLSSLVFILAFDEVFKYHNVPYRCKAFSVTYDKYFDATLNKLLYSEVLSRVKDIEEIRCQGIGYSNAFKLDKQIICSSDYIIALYDARKLTHFYTSLRLAKDSGRCVQELTKQLIDSSDTIDSHLQVYQGIIDLLQERLNTDGYITYTASLPS